MRFSQVCKLLLQRSSLRWLCAQRLLHFRHKFINCVGLHLVSNRILNRGYFRTDLRRSVLPLGHLLPVRLGIPVGYGHVVHRLRRGEKSLESVIVTLRDGIVLVIMTSSTAKRQAQKHGRGSIGDVVEDLL